MKRGKGWGREGNEMASKLKISRDPYRPTVFDCTGCFYGVQRLRD